MSVPLFQTQKESSYRSSRNTVIAVLAVVLSSVLHLGTYEVVRDRVVSFLQTVAETISPTKVDEIPTRVEIYEPPKIPVSKELLKSLDPSTAISRLPSDILSQQPPSEVFSAPPSEEPMAIPSVLPPPPEVAEETRVPPPGELFAADLLAVSKVLDDALEIPVLRHDILSNDRKLIAPDPASQYAAPATLPAVDIRDALSRVPQPLAAPVSSWITNLPPPTMFSAVDANDQPAPAISPLPDGQVASQLMAEPLESIAPAVPLDDRLSIRTAAVRPDSDPEHVYFQIDILPRDAEALPDVPRDIVFVQDTSNSLSFRRLPPCLKAISAALRTLGPQDRFNICVFSDTTSFLRRDGWLEPNAETLAAADAFLAPIQSGGNTDLFQSMHDILSLPRDPNRAQIAILLTDGRITAGSISRDSAVIGTFSRLNAGVFSVFTVNVNATGNAYLLDMLSFCDRGGNTAISGSRFDIGKTIETVVSSIGQPILTNVHFQFDSNTSTEAYPRLTSNLYRNRPIRLLGRVRADAPTFAFQARGDANGDQYDMLFEVDLQDSSTAEAPESLVKDWATQQMYDLVSTYAMTEDATLLTKMQRLGVEYGIPVPHAGRIGVTTTPAKP